MSSFTKTLYLDNAIDHDVIIHKYVVLFPQVLSRGESETVGLEELDAIQVDLETLLASAGKRLKVLENEIQILQNWQEKNGEIKPIGKSKGGKMVQTSKCSLDCHYFPMITVSPFFSQLKT